MHGIGETLGRTDEIIPARLVPHGDDDALANRPIALLTGKPDVIEHLPVHRLRGTAQRQFAQGR